MRRAVLVCLLSCVAAPALAAQSAASGIHVDPATKVARAVRLAGPAPRVDGRLDDPAWRLAEWFSDFIMKEPHEGAEPTERTEVGILYDDAALYIAFRAWSNDPAAIQRNVGRRDGSGLGQSEHIWISFDTFRDRFTAYSFGITASGVRMDWYHPTDNEFNMDVTFDPVWEGRARVDSAGWSAELRIPFSQLRFRDQPVQVWGMNVDRWIPSRNEDLFWIPVPRNVQAWSSRMGRLEGIEGIRPATRVELLPYVAGGATLSSGADPGNPFNPDGRSGEARLGGDAKFGLGPNMTLDVTVNPDFGQVELDPAVVNLSAFEVFFDERRPFFTERSDLLRANGPAWFYSRRIGAAPAGAAAGDYVDRPRSSTILGATKLTGRMASGMSVGALAAVTAREHARTFDVASGTHGTVEVAAPAGFGVLRLQQELGSNASTAGLMITGVRRDLGGSPLATLLPEQTVSGGLDWNIRLRGGQYEIGGWAGFSQVSGDSAAILRQQLSSRRYYQRPDQDYVGVNSGATSLGGYALGLSAARRSGRHWLWNVNASVESPGLELNDAGRIATADGRTVGGTLTYRETRVGRLFRNYSLSFNSFGEWNFGGERQFSFNRFDGSFTWRNQWQTYVTFWVDHWAQDERLTRGGPSMAIPLSWVTIWQLRSNFAARNQWSVRAYYGENAFDGLTYRFSGGLTLRPAPRWSLSVSPNYLYDRNPRQFVTAVADAAASATYGTRYVFATIAQTQWSAPLRLNYAFTPDLTLELYGEPFVASGHYYRHGELDRPRGRDLLVYGEDVPLPGSVTIPARDFNFVSFRSNAVLRWEWRRGSALYLVWQQNRGEETATGRRVRTADLFDGLGSRGDTFLAVKVAYWLSAR
jgi:hypothetical protein